jgi:hypothetical protein
MGRILLRPLSPLFLSALAMSAALSVYVAARVEFSPAILELSALGWFFFLLVWIEADARRSRRTPCFDFPWLCAICLPVSLPWYCFRTRGLRGLLLLLLFAFLWLLPYLTAFAVALAVYVVG